MSSAHLCMPAQTLQRRATCVAVQGGAGMVCDAGGDAGGRGGVTHGDAAPGGLLDRASGATILLEDPSERLAGVGFAAGVARVGWHGAGWRGAAGMARHGGARRGRAGRGAAGETCDGTARLGGFGKAWLARRRRFVIFAERSPIEIRRVWGVALPGFFPEIRPIFSRGVLPGRSGFPRDGLRRAATPAHRVPCFGVDRAGGSRGRDRLRAAEKQQRRREVRGARLRRRHTRRAVPLQGGQYAPGSQRS